MEITEEEMDHIKVMLDDYIDAREEWDQEVQENTRHIVDNVKAVVKRYDEMG